MRRTTRGHGTRRNHSRPCESAGICSPLSRPPNTERASLLAGTALVSILLLSFLLGSNSAQAASCTKPPPPAPISDLNVNDAIICVNTEPRTNLAGNAVELSTIGNNHHIDLYNNGLLTAYEYGIFASTTGNNSLITIENVGDIGAGDDGIFAATSGDSSIVTITNSGATSAGDEGIDVDTFGAQGDVFIVNTGAIVSGLAGLFDSDGIEVDTYGYSSSVTVINSGVIVSGVDGISVDTLGNQSPVHITNNASGAITADAIGIVAMTVGAYSPVHITNDAAIVAFGTSGYADYGYGILVTTASPNSDINIANTGDISEPGVGIGAAAYGFNSDIFITNSGEILATSPIRSAGIGTIALFGRIDIINEGDISASSETGNAYGILALSVVAFGPASPTSIENSGDITAGTDDGDAFGIFAQTARSYSPISIENSGDLSAMAGNNSHGIFARTFGGGSDIAIANSGDISSGDNGIYALTTGDTATVAIVNSGDIQGGKVGPDYSAGIYVMTQGASTEITVANSGNLDSVYGVLVLTYGQSNQISVSNSGDINSIYGGTRAFDFGGGAYSEIDIENSANIASVYFGISGQTTGDHGSINIDNSGDITTTYAAFGFGIGARTDGDYSSIQILNSGAIDAAGLAISTLAPGFDSDVEIVNSGAIDAGDIGIRARTLGAMTDLTVINSGEISAGTSGILALSYGASSPIVIKNGGTIDAIGVGIHTSGISSIEVLNSGIVASEGTGVLVTTSFGQSPADGTVTVTNDGGAIISELAGLRGVAIDLSDAPHPALIDLIGNNPDGLGSLAGSKRLSSFLQNSVLSGVDDYGYIFGDIITGSDDAILVENGLTVLDGVVNPDEALDGELEIDATGKLVLVQNPIDGPSAVFVDHFEHELGGNLVYELTASSAPGDYPTIVADTANIAGTFTALYQPDLYDDFFVYEDIIDTNLLASGFDTARTADNSVLLVTTAVNDANENIDLVVERTAFDDVAGLTKNQEAVGGGIEDVYDNISDGSEDFQDLIASLFTIDNADDYALFLDQLTGAEYAQHLQSVLWSTRPINWIINERMECAGTGGGYVQPDGSMVEPTADVVPVVETGCFIPGQASYWVRGFGSWNSHDGDQNAPGYDEDQYGVIFGADYAFDENWFGGIAGGYFDSNMDFDGWGGRKGASIDNDGIQLAAYGGYDDSIWYLRGVVSYGDYDGNSNRLIEFGPSAIDPSGDPSSDTFSFDGETGYRWGMADTGSITPFLGLSLATATLDGFTENDPFGTGAALKIHSSDADSVASRLGVRFMGDWGMGGGSFYPELSVAWEHEFDDTTQKVEMSFAEGPPGADFTVVSAKTARDSVLLEAGAKFAIDNTMDFGVYYNGRFNEDYDANAVTGRLGIKF